MSSTSAPVQIDQDRHLLWGRIGENHWPAKGSESIWAGSHGGTRNCTRGPTKQRRAKGRKVKDGWDWTNRGRRRHRISVPWDRSVMASAIVVTWAGRHLFPSPSGKWNIIILHRLGVKSKAWKLQTWSSSLPFDQPASFEEGGRERESSISMMLLCIEIRNNPSRLNATPRITWTPRAHGPEPYLVEKWRESTLGEKNLKRKRRKLRYILMM